MVQDREGAFHLFVSRGWPCLILIKKTPPPNHCFFTMKPKSVSLFRFHPRRPPFSVSLVFYNETAERFTFSFHSVSGFRFHTVFGLNYCFLQQNVQRFTFSFRSVSRFRFSVSCFRFM